MAEYLIQGETLDEIADAINAKTGGSAAMTPAEMVTAIGSISGGGGSLPSIISKIDGGSFTPASDLQSSALSISHSLGVVPKGFVIWTEDEISGTIATRYAAQFFMTASDVHRSNGDVYVAVGGATILYNGGTSMPSVNATSAQISSFMTASTIDWNNNLIYCKAGLTYKWLAWA